MDSLYPLLSKMNTLLDDLERLITEEIHQLSQPKINPVSLQVLTDNKSQLLSGLGYYDQQRQQQEERCNITAPYSRQANLGDSWQQISQKVARTRSLNTQAEALLHRHMARNTQLKEIVDNISRSGRLYSAEGQAQPAANGRSYHFRV